MTTDHVADHLVLIEIDDLLGCKLRTIAEDGDAIGNIDHVVEECEMKIRLWPSARNLRNTAKRRVTSGGDKAEVGSSGE